MSTDDTAREASRQAGQFRRLRSAHQVELAEDYVELIADLIEQTGEARVADLATRFGVTNATVTNSIRRLQRDGLVTCKPYRSIYLTEKGQELAFVCRERHRVVRAFLMALGIDAETADSDAEGIEHHVSEATLDAFRKFLRKGPRERR